MKRLLATALAWTLFTLACPAATLLPNGEQSFTDQNGQPLAFGTVQFYVPGTTTNKNTWKESGQTSLNTNPIHLDGSGRAIIYGSGVYRQIVKDSAGNLIWDQVTADTSANSYSWAGTSAGTANAQTITAANFTVTDGQQIGFIAGYTNTGAFTLTVNNGTPINVVKDTTAGPVALSGGEITTQNQYVTVYDATLGEFHLVAYPIAPGIGAALPLAASTITNIGTIGTHDVSLTGTSTITSFGASASLSAPVYLVQFQAAGTIITASASIQTPSGSNIKTAAGDSATLLYLGSGNWQIITYTATGIAGEVRAFDLSSCPAGWNAADGTNGTVDMRGYVARGLDTGGTIDPSRTLGSLQQDQIHSFTTSIPAFVQGVLASNTGASSAYLIQTPQQALASTSSFTGATFGSETRMKNVALLYCQHL